MAKFKIGGAVQFEDTNIEKIEEENITYNERLNKILGEKPLRHNLEYSMRICEYTMIKKMETI